MRWKTWPNLVTLAGILLVLLYVFAYLTETRDFILVTLVLACMTDFLDGFLARLLKQESRVGFYLDPIRDKAIFLAVIGNLVFVWGFKTLIFASLAMASETAVAVLNSQRGFKNVRIHPLGKFRGFGYYTISGVIILATYYFPGFSFDLVGAALLTMGGLAVIAFAGYASDAIKERRARAIPR